MRSFRINCRAGRRRTVLNRGLIRPLFLARAAKEVPAAALASACTGVGELGRERGRTAVRESEGAPRRRPGTNYNYCAIPDDDDGDGNPFLIIFSLMYFVTRQKRASQSAR